MASSKTKKPCTKCDKRNGIIMCHGCEQSYCTKHIVEHRQELATQMDNIGQEYDLLQRDSIKQETDLHSSMMRIDAWEQESITKIQVAAEVARTELRNLMGGSRHELKATISKLTDELRSSRESDDYTEFDLDKWAENIKELRQILDKPLIIDIVDDNMSSSIIYLIKVKENRNPPEMRSSKRSFQEIDQSACSLRELNVTIHEKFDQTVGPVTFSQENLVATCSDMWYCNSSVSGIIRYSNGIHRIRFRIENRTINNLFFGISSTSQHMIPWILHSVSTYGWWGLEWTVVNGKEQWSVENHVFRTGDEVTLTLNCDNKRIQFEHHRTNRIVHLLVDIQQCPLPWKILIGLSNRNDSVRIIH